MNNDELYTKSLKIIAESMQSRISSLNEMTTNVLPVVTKVLKEQNQYQASNLAKSAGSLFRFDEVKKSYSKLMTPVFIEHLQSVQQSQTNRISSLVLASALNNLVKSISSDIENTETDIETDILNLEDHLIALSTESDLSDEDKEKLLLAIEFISQNDINNLDDSTDEMIPSIDAHTVSDQNQTNNIDGSIDKTCDSPNEKESEKEISNVPHPLLQKMSDSDFFYGELASFILQFLFATLQSVAAGKLEPVIFVFLVINLLRIFIPNKK